MQQVGGYLISYSDARVIMDGLQIPEKGVYGTMLDFPLNDWLVKTKRYKIACTTVGHVYSSYKDAEGVLLVTRIKTGGWQDDETLVEGDKDKHMKTRLMEEGGVKEDCLQWISFKDRLGLGFSSIGTRPKRNDYQGRWTNYKLTKDQAVRAARTGKPVVDEWAAEVIANGEAVEILHPPQQEPPHP